MSKKENKQNPEKREKNKEKESWKEEEKDRDLESGDNPDERRRMSGS